MAIVNGTCVSFCIQPKAKFGHLMRVTPVCRCLQWFCGWKHLATSRESEAHFGLPWVRPAGTIVVNVTRLERGFNACKTPRCIYPSIFNRFWDIASYWSEIATFSYPTSVQRPIGGWPRRNFAKILIYTKLEWMGYRVVKKHDNICSAVLIQYQRVTDRRTDGRTDRRTSSL